MNPFWERTLENMSQHSPDQEIVGYIRSTYTRECQSDLITALAILYGLEYRDIQEQLVGMINGIEAEDNEGLSKLVADTITAAMDKVFDLWGIVLNSDVMLSVKNNVATALTFIPSIEDPIPYLRILETDLSNEEKVARIVQACINQAEVVTLDALLEVRQFAIDRLYKQLEKQEASAPELLMEVNPKQLDNFKKFCDYVGKDHTAYQMLQNEFKFGLTSEIYLPYVISHMDTGRVESTAMNLLSFYLLAADTWESPIDHFRKQSERFVSDMRDVLAIEGLMRSTLESFEQYKKASHEST